MNTKIAIASLSNRGFRPETVKSLLELKCPYEKEIIIATQGYHIAENRNFIATKAIKENCDYIFTVDDDMIFPSDILEKMLAHKKDIVGVAYHPRFEIDKNTHKPLDKTHIITLKDKGSKELFECEAVRTGVMLINTKILHEIPRPWFSFKNHELGYTTQGEDWWFCEKAIKAGFKVFCDPSFKIGHIGTKIY